MFHVKQWAYGLISYVYPFVPNSETT